MAARHSVSPLLPVGPVTGDPENTSGRIGAVPLVAIGVAELCVRFGELRLSDAIGSWTAAPPFTPEGSGPFSVPHRRRVGIGRGVFRSR